MPLAMLRLIWKLIINLSRNASQLLLTHFLPVFPFIQKQPPEVLCKKAVLKNVTKFTGKLMFWSLFFNKVTGLQLY